VERRQHRHGGDFHVGHRRPEYGRAIAIDFSTLEDDIGDETLLAWLKAAPRIGRLT